MFDTMLGNLRAEWKTAGPDRRAEIEGDVANIKAAQTRAAEWAATAAAAAQNRADAERTSRTRRGREWPIERIRALMAEANPTAAAA